MSLKDDIKDVSNEVKEVQEQHSLAWDILTMLKKQNKSLMLSNIILAICLSIALMIIILR